MHNSTAPAERNTPQGITPSIYGQFLGAKKRPHDDKTRGLRLFRELCGTCHGPSGRGLDNLAPTLQKARIVEKGPQYIALSILNGIHGPVTIDGEEIEFAAAMPGLSANQLLTDQDIADISNYISNSFVSPPEKVEASEIARLRSLSDQMEKPSTEVEIIERIDQSDL